MIPGMSYRRLAELELPSGTLLTSVQEALTPLGVSVYLVEERDLIDAAIQRDMPRVGVSWFWRRGPLTEAVLPKTNAPQPLIVLLANMLATFSPVSRLVIVDPYFYPRTWDGAYVGRVEAALSQVLSTLVELVIITSTRFEPAVKTAIDQRLSSANPALTIVHRTTEDFHDRFWIADEKSGIFVGTSLNGVGLRYAVTDFLAGWDVLDIVDALKQRALI